jgi:4-hydroxy-tetrahydrodipicolinate synthase
MGDLMTTHRKRLHGSIPALITPFRDGALDLDSFVLMVERQIRRGSRGLVVAGTTGEAACLGIEEYRRLLDVAAAVTRHRIPLIAGVTASCTQQAVDLARQAEHCEADMLLVGMPPYLRPPQEGLFQHVSAVHDAMGLPILLYDVPSRSGSVLSDETVARLAELPRVIGIKDATGDLQRPARLQRLIGDAFLQFSGNDATTVEHRLAGGHGCISVTANVVPALCGALQEQFDAGNLDAVRRLKQRLQPLNEALFLDSNPIPVKRAMNLLGFCSNELRLPLVPLGAAADAVLTSVLEVVWAAEEAFVRSLGRAAASV